MRLFMTILTKIWLLCLETCRERKRIREVESDRERSKRKERVGGGKERR